MRRAEKKQKRRILDLLRVLKKLPPHEFSRTIDHLSDDAVDCLCETVYNILNTDLKLNTRQRNKLKRHIKSRCSINRLKSLSKKEENLSKRRKALKMEGRGLPLLLGAAIPFLSSLLFGGKNA